MNATRIEANKLPMRLLPHQLAFVETVFNPASKRVILLRADVGLGKSAALVAVFGRLTKNWPVARALLISAPLPCGSNLL